MLVIVLLNATRDAESVTVGVPVPDTWIDRDGDADGVLVQLGVPLSEIDADAEDDCEPVDVGVHDTLAEADTDALDDVDGVTEGDVCVPVGVPVMWGVEATEGDIVLDAEGVVAGVTVFVGVPVVCGVAGADLDKDVDDDGEGVLDPVVVAVIVADGDVVGVTVCVMSAD